MLWKVLALRGRDFILNRASGSQVRHATFNIELFRENPNDSTET